MTGFDPTKFLAPELPFAGGSEAAPEAPAVATVASASPVDESLTIDEETGEILNGWASVPASVAGVATVAELPLNLPFARELNAMFFYPRPAYVRPRAWRRICEDARTFVESGKAAAALAAGWEPIELFGCWRDMPRRAEGVRALATNGIVMLLNGRKVGSVEEHAIEILNKMGAHNRAYRAHFMTRRALCVPIWEAFRPVGHPPDA